MTGAVARRDAQHPLPLRAGVLIVVPVLLGAMLALLPAAFARAADGVKFSTDGVGWSETPPTGLFPGVPRMVPGDTVSTQLWLRNTHVSPLVLTIVVTDIAYDSAAAGARFGLAGRDGAGEGLSRTALADIAACTALIPARTLSPGEVVAITVDVDLDASAAGTEAQADGIDFTLAVGLIDPGVELPPYGCPADPTEIPLTPDGPDDRGAVALTGSDLAARAVLLALAMGAAGWLLLLLSRRRRSRA